MKDSLLLWPINTSGNDSVLYCYAFTVSQHSKCKPNPKMLILKDGKFSKIDNNKLRYPGSFSKCLHYVCISQFATDWTHSKSVEILAFIKKHHWGGDPSLVIKNTQLLKKRSLLQRSTFVPTINWIWWQWYFLGSKPASGLSLHICTPYRGLWNSAKWSLCLPSYLPCGWSASPSQPLSSFLPLNTVSPSSSQDLCTHQSVVSSTNERPRSSQLSCSNLNAISSEGPPRTCFQRHSSPDEPLIFFISAIHVPFIAIS